MADLKISQLPSATTPLAGTEVLPIVQSSATKQVSIANLTAGRSVSVADATLTTGNLVIGTSGKGIDFSATGELGGMTSELLNDYEIGTFTPTGTSFTVVGTATWTGSYTKIGRLVFWQAKVVASTTITAAEGTAYITMPFYVRGGSYSALGTASNASGFTGYGNGMYVDASLQFYSPAFPPGPVVVFSGVYQTD